MYKGKWLKGFCKKSGKSIALLVSLVLIIGVIVGGAVAFLIDSTGSVNNQFTPSKVTTEVTEKCIGTTKSDVAIKNTGDTDAWIRAAVVVTWQDEAGNVYGKAPKANVDYTAWTLGTDWKQGGDGFYYYTKPVAAGAKTSSALIDKIEPIGYPPADGYHLTVEIIGSGIQSKPANVFDTEWDSSGLSVKDKDDQGKALDPMQWTLIKQGGAGN